MKKLFLLSFLFLLLWSIKSNAQTNYSTFPGNVMYGWFDYPHDSLNIFSVNPDPTGAGEATLGTICIIWLSSDNGPDLTLDSDSQSGNTVSGCSYSQTDVDNYKLLYTNVIFHFYGEIDYGTNPNYDFCSVDDQWPI